RDYVYVNDLPDAATVLEKLAEWMEDYNNWHPHKGLKDPHANTVKPY
ncbi:integrase core domain-containing protein, partial [Serratia symbiotica]